MIYVRLFDRDLTTPVGIAMRWFRTIGLRLALALGLSFSLWLFVSLSENPYQTASFNGLPVEIRGLSPGLVSVDNNGFQQTSFPPINITVEADAQTLERHVASSDIRTFVDLRDKGVGEYLVPVVAETNRSDLSRLNFDKIEPSNLSIRLEQLITRTVPLQIKTEGNLPFSFEAGALQVSDADQSINSVSVVGPQSRAVQVNSVQAVANIEQLRADYTALVTLRPFNEQGQVVAGVTVAPEEVRVRVPIRSVAGLRRVAVLGRITGFPADGYAVSGVVSDPQLVNLTGSSGPLDTVNQIETEPIDVARATTTFTREVNLLVPVGTSLQVGESSKVTVTVQIAPVTRPFRVTLPVPVTAIGVANGLLVTINPQIVDVAVVGPSGALTRLGSTTVQGTVNVTGRGPGTYTIVPDVPLPSDVRLASPIPDVTITLRSQPTVLAASTATSQPAAPTATGQPTGSTATSQPASPTEPPSLVPTATVPATGAPGVPEVTSTPAPVPPTSAPGITPVNSPSIVVTDIVLPTPEPSAARIFATPIFTIVPTATIPK